MKIIGSILIILALSLLGKISSSKLSKRVRYITTIIHALEFAENEITYNMTSVKNLFKKLSQNSYFNNSYFNNSFFDKTYLNLAEGKSFEKSWISAIETTDFADVFTSEELEEVSRIGSWLGTSSAKQQISSLESAVSFLKLQLTKAQEEKQKYCKIYSSFGVLSGMMLVILIW